METQSMEGLLVFSAANGDLNAFNQLVLTYQDIAYRHAYAIMGDPDEAEDVTQESFIKAFQSIGSYRGGFFRAWLLRIISNTSFDRLREIRNHPSTPLFPQDPDAGEYESPKWLRDPALSVEAQVENKEEATRLDRMLDEIPEVYRHILILIDVHNLDYAEAAQALHIPVGTVKSRLARARLKIIQKLRTSPVIPPAQAGCMEAIC